MTLLALVLVVGAVAVLPGTGVAESHIGDGALCTPTDGHTNVSWSNLGRVDNTSTTTTRGFHCAIDNQTTSTSNVNHTATVYYVDNHSTGNIGCQLFGMELDGSTQTFGSPIVNSSQNDETIHSINLTTTSLGGDWHKGIYCTVPAIEGAENPSRIYNYIAAW
jgi:hypothetical protein